MNFQIIEGDVLIRDVEGNPIAVQRDGAYYQLAVTDQTTQETLHNILAELKKITFQLTLITGEQDGS